jgi:hypothetical protein
MIEAPHPLHPHSRLLSYRYKVLWHLLLWLVFMRMQCQPDICLVSQYSCGGRRFSWFLTCIMLQVMIEAPHPLYTHSRFTSHIYNAPATVASGHKDATPTWYCSLRPESNVLSLSVEGGSLLVLMIESPHYLHTHIRSSCYIYNAIQHLLQRLVVIRMQPQPDICSLRHLVRRFSWSLTWSVLMLLFRPPTHFILIPGLLHTYIVQFSTCYSGYRP